MADESLIIHKFHPVVHSQPLNVHYQSYEADSSEIQNIAWNIDSPFAGALLDNEVYVEYTVTLNSFAFKDTFVGGPALGTPPFTEMGGFPLGPTSVAMRPGWAVHGALSNAEVILNGQSIRQTPYRFMPEFARFYSHPLEIDGVCSMSGGALDSGSHDSVPKDMAAEVPTLGLPGHISVAGTTGFAMLNTGAWRVDTVSALNFIFGQFPTTGGHYYNEGFTKRVHALRERWRETGAANAEGNHTNLLTRFTESFTFQVWERLPISPFMMWEAKDGHRSIPYIDKMEVSLQFYSNARKLMLQYTCDDADIDSAAVDWFTIKPKLHLKWYIPPPGMTMAPELSIPVSLYKESVRQVTNLTAPLATQGVPPVSNEITYENLRLQQIPDMMMIYVKPNANTQEARFGIEHHLEITEVEITLNGDSGKALRASQGELFAMYVRNSPMKRERKFDFTEWRKRYCTLAFKPHDLGVRVPPGVNHGITLDVRLKVRNWWSKPMDGANTVIAAGESTTYTTLGGTAPFTRDIFYGTLDTEDSHSFTYEINILGVYDKYELTLTNRGNAQLKLQNVPSLDLPQAVAPTDRRELRGAF